MNNKDDENLRAALQQAQQQVDGPTPEFAALLSAAGKNARREKSSRYAAIAAAAAIGAIALMLFPERPDEIVFIDASELATTTSWTAPSDSLLPIRRFDIYEEIPEIFESTNSLDGALL